MHILERQANLDEDKHDFFLAEWSLLYSSLEEGVQIPALYRGLNYVLGADSKVVRSDNAWEPLQRVPFHVPLRHPIHEPRNTP